MKLNLLKPYPGEIFFSWISRNYLMLGISQEHFLDLVFGKRSTALYLIMPFKDRITEKDVSEYLDIAKNNSMLTILQPFITSNDYNEIIKGRKVNNMKVAIRGYKICPLCYQEDMRKYGETYLRIDHQVEGNYVCHIHQIDLVQIEDYKSEKNIRLFEPENIKNQLQIRHEYKEPIYSEISEMLYEIVNEKTLKGISLETTRKKYHNRLKELGYYRYSVVNQKKLVNAIRHYYGDEILSKLGCDIKDGSEVNSWVRRLLISSNEELSKPIRHILMIKFLFGNLASFMNYDKEYMPFGIGPWKCINPVCEKYDEACIKTVMLSKGSKEGEIRGEWQCTCCGIKYSRKGPIEIDDDFYKKAFIIEYGEKWEKRFIEICNDQTMTLNDIANNMKCSYQTVKNQMRRLNIVRQHNQENIEDLLVQAKGVLLGEIESTLNINRQDLMNRHHKEYLFLLENDREWINNCGKLPNYSKNTANNKKANESFWEEKDKEMESVVKRIVGEILNANLPIRITLQMLIRETKYHPLAVKQYMEKMPRTRMVIDQYREDAQQYKRRIKQIRK